MNLEELLSRINIYTNEERSKILTAYDFAREHHEGQSRKSGEPYITHPTAVACILTDMYMDADTICAGLLHDTIEDCKDVDRELLDNTFNPTIGLLVDGVTKIKHDDPKETDEEYLYKILTSFTLDIRIILIKLADRLHNMRTLKYHDDKGKIQRIAFETLMIYVPIASLLGHYTIKTELEDLCFQFLHECEYNEFLEMVNDYEKNQREQIDKILYEISVKLNELDVQNSIKFKRKNIAGIYRKYNKYHDFSSIHDMHALKILVPSNDLCYEIRDKLINDLKFVTLQTKDKDYIAHPKNNKYMGLHSSIFLPESGYLQLQFKTPEMYKINAYGITAYFDHEGRKGRNVNEIMQDEVKKMEFYKTLVELGEENIPSDEYIKIVRSDILTRMIYLDGIDKNTLELPEGSTPVDYAFKTDPERARYIDYALVGGRVSPINYQLESRDNIRIIYGDKPKNPEELINSSRCMLTKRKIMKK